MLRSALRPDAVDEEQFRQVMDGAVGSADRRRGRRRAGASILLTLGAAACVGGAVVLGPTFSAHEEGDVVAAEAPLSALETADSSVVTTTDVQTVLPGAQPFLARGPWRPFQVPLSDACQTGALDGVAVPTTLQRSGWISGARPLGDDPEGATSIQDPAEVGSLDALVVSFADSEQARRYLEALRASVPACIAAQDPPTLVGTGAGASAGDGGGAGGSEQQTAGSSGTRDREAFTHVWDHRQGSWVLTTVVVHDRVAVRVDAALPAAVEVGFVDAVRAVEGLAGQAAVRAASA